MTRSDSETGGIPMVYMVLFAWLLATAGMFAFRAVRGSDGLGKPRPSGVSALYINEAANFSVAFLTTTAASICNHLVPFILSSVDSSQHERTPRL